MTGRRPSAAPAGRMSDAQTDATTAELGRLVFGGRPERPELEPTRSEILAFHRTRARQYAAPPAPRRILGSTGQNPIIKGRRG